MFLFMTLHLQAIGTPLLPHQKQALAWMISRENSKELPPFWEQRNDLYYNTITNFSVKQQPENVHGGILADDMGLVIFFFNFSQENLTLQLQFSKIVKWKDGCQFRTGVCFQFRCKIHISKNYFLSIGFQETNRWIKEQKIVKNG